MLSHAYEPESRNTSLPSVSPPENNESGILVGGYRLSNKQEILAAIPSKSIVDKLVAGYFLDRPIVPSKYTRLGLSAKAETSSHIAWPDVP